jgi:GH24 family phage-related lysozyme (muramidase)
MIEGLSPVAGLYQGPNLPIIRSSLDAINLIVTREETSKEYYATHYMNFEWPKRASGPTVGIGYDCGYVTAGEICAEWTDFIPNPMVSALMKAAGLKGQDARRFVERYGKSVTITWDQALAQFMGRQLPKWESRIIKALPNALMLAGDCFGALTSIGFNRGTGGFCDPGPRWSEMRHIKAHMIAREFDKIPDEILAMRRLWPDPKDGLYTRRTAEAELFKRGLKTLSSAKG